MKNRSSEEEHLLEIIMKRGDNGLVTFEVLLHFIAINNWVLGPCVAIIGLVSNILNIIIFAKQGLRDTVNISLLGLTISDLGSLVFQFFINLCWNPSIIKLDLPFYPDQMMYFLFWGHVIFTRVTTGTTAWITFERCLCIAAPLRVKDFVTPRRTIVYISVLYVIMMAAVAPIFYTSRFSWIFDPSKNKSLLGYVKINNRMSLEGVVYLINNCLPVIFFIIIVVCTLLLVKSLRRNAKWRQQTTALLKANVLSIRDTKLVKMILIISTVFIFCYAPGAVMFVWLAADPEMKIDGKQKNLMGSLFSILLNLEAINASVNFFIYMKMSSKFVITFQQVFCLSYEGRTERDA